MAAAKKERAPSHSWTTEEDRELIRMLNSGATLDDAEAAFPGVTRTSIASHARTVSLKMAERGVTVPRFKRSAGVRGEQWDALAEFAADLAPAAPADEEVEAE